MLNWIRNSRKAKLTLAAILGLVATGLTGEMTWAQVVAYSVAVIIGAITGIAIEDAGTKAAGKTPGG